MPAHETIEPVEQHLGVVGPAQPALQGPDRRLAADVERRARAGWRSPPRSGIHATRCGAGARCAAWPRRGAPGGLRTSAAARSTALARREWRSAGAAALAAAHDGRAQPRAVLADPGPGGIARRRDAQAACNAPRLLFEVAPERSMPAPSRARFTRWRWFWASRSGPSASRSDRSAPVTRSSALRGTTAVHGRDQQREQPARADPQLVDRARPRRSRQASTLRRQPAPLLVEEHAEGSPSPYCSCESIRRARRRAIIRSLRSTLVERFSRR